MGGPNWPFFLIDKGKKHEGVGIDPLMFKGNKEETRKEERNIQLKLVGNASKY